MIGHMVGGYKITEKIGEGGMGDVFKGIDVMLEREVAIKMLKPELASQPQVVERFRAEAVTLARLNHPNIATLYTFVRQGNNFFMVMEFVRGETVDSIIRRSGAMDCNSAVRLFCQALEGIDHAHLMGIIHRDIKPANMMLTETGSIKVMDFGIARVLGSARMTRQGHVVGTIEYMSPEQVKGLEADVRSDIYSLGILLYEMLTGRLPFNADSEFELMRAQIEEAPTPPRTFAMHVPLAIEQAIMRSLAKKPEARYQTAGEFRAVLLNASGISANPPAHLNVGYVTPRPLAADSHSNISASREAVKETRLPGEGTNPAGFAGNQGWPTAAPGMQLKETRLGQAGGMQQTPAQTAGQYFGDQTQPAKAPASLFGKLNWKHYSGAAAALLFSITIPIAMSILREKPVSPPPAAIPQAEPAPSATPPSPSAEQNAQPSPSQPQAQSDPVFLPLDGKTEAPASDSSRQPRPRSARSGKPQDTPVAAQPQPSQPTPQPAAAVAPPPRPQPAAQPTPQPKEEKPMAAPAGEKKGVADKVVGGIKKLFGRGKKDEKKP